MVIPEERENDFERKMKSPLFSEHFAKDNWTLAYFNTLREAFTKTKAKTDLESLFGKKKSAGGFRYKRQASEAQALFEIPESGKSSTTAAWIMKDDGAD